MSNTKNLMVSIQLDMIEMNKELIFEAKSNINEAFTEYQAGLDKIYNKFSDGEIDEITFHKENAKLATWLQQVVTLAATTLSNETEKLEANTNHLSELRKM